MGGGAQHGRPSPRSRSPAAAPACCRSGAGDRAQHPLAGEGGDAAPHAHPPPSIKSPLLRRREERAVSSAPLPGFSAGLQPQRWWQAEHAAQGSHRRLCCCLRRTDVPALTPQLQGAGMWPQQLRMVSGEAR